VKKVKVSEILLLLVLLLAFLPGIIVYQQLPDQVPTHWNIHGQIDGYGSKFTAVVLMPLLNFCLYFLLKYIPRIDPKAKNYFYFTNSYTIMRWAIHLFMAGIQIVILWSTYQGAIGAAPVDPSKFIMIGVCLLFVVIGNYMGRFRHNYFVGIRNPWTLASEEVWDKTHRLGSKVWVASGIVGLFGLFFGSELRVLFLLFPILVGNVFLTGYSYWIFRKLSVD
jgi:uncharacterized membrane protein